MTGEREKRPYVEETSHGIAFVRLFGDYSAGNGNKSRN